MDCDVCVIGGGLLGCMAARNLCRYRLNVLVLERREDVCTGISRANTAIVYAGYDHRPGTLKADMTVQANLAFDGLCRELGVRFDRCGSLMVSLGPCAEERLRQKLEQGRRNGVPDLRLLSRAQALAMEPALSPQIIGALYAPTTGTVNPWELGIAAFENARANGCRFRFDAEVTGIERTDKGFGIHVRTPEGTVFITAGGILNCAGLYADRVHELLFPPSVRIFPEGADYLVADGAPGKPVNRIIFTESEDGKGLTVVPTTDGNLLLGPTEGVDPDRPHFAAAGAGLDRVGDQTARLLPDWPLEERLLRDFASVRPHPFEVIRTEAGWRPTGRRIGSFAILQDPACPAMVSLVGIKTPGLTCCDRLTRHAARLLREGMDMAWTPRPDFDPIRPAPVKVSLLSPAQKRQLTGSAYRDILCVCGQVTEGEVRDAIRRGAVTVDGVKRRCGIGMGVCQGSRCTRRVMELLAEELGVPPEQIKKDGPGSWIVKSRDG